MATYRVFIAGDSISDVGAWPGITSPYLPRWGGTVDDYWCAKLEAWLNTTYPEHTWQVYKKAMSGATWARWDTGDQYLPNGSEEITSVAPHFVFYLIGINDSISYSVTTMQTHMRSVFDSVDAVDHGVPGINGGHPLACVLSLVRLDEGKNCNGASNAVAINYSDAVKSEAASRGYHVADVWSAFAALQVNAPSWTEVHPYFAGDAASDGVHPSALGQDLIFDTVIPVATQMFDSVMAPDPGAADFFARLPMPYVPPAPDAIDFFARLPLRRIAIPTRPGLITKPPLAKTTGPRDNAAIVMPKQWSAASIKEHWPPE